MISFVQEHEKGFLGACLGPRSGDLGGEAFSMDRRFFMKTQRISKITEMWHELSRDLGAAARSGNRWHVPQGPAVAAAKRTL